MAKKMVLISDLSAAEINKPAVIKVMIEDEVFVLDADAEEDTVQALVVAGRKQSKRGRKPGSRRQ